MWLPLRVHLDLENAGREQCSFTMAQTTRGMMALASHLVPLEARAVPGGESRKVTYRQFRFPSSCPSKFCNVPLGDSADSLFLELQDEEQEIGFRNEDLGILPCQ